MDNIEFRELIKVYFVGPSWLKHAASAMGVAPSTVRSWCYRRDRQPSYKALVKLSLAEEKRLSQIREVTRYQHRLVDEKELAMIADCHAGHAYVLKALKAGERAEMNKQGRMRGRAAVAREYRLRRSFL